MRPLHVLTSVDAVGGVWTYAADLARCAAAHGVRTTLAVLGPAPSKAQRAMVEAIRGLDLIETGLPLDWTAETPARATKAARDFAELARGLRPDVIHLNTPALAARQTLPAPTLGVCHSCLPTWWAAVRGGAMPEDFVWRGQMVQEGLRRCDELIAPSQAFSDATEAAHGVRPKVVRNGRSALGGKPALAVTPRLFAAGRLWDDGKGIATFDSAVALLGVEALAAGPIRGPQGQEVSLPHLRTPGALSTAEVARRLSARPIFVSPALYEPFGLGVLEAAQHACPLVLSDIPTFRELWGDAALFFSPRDPRDLARQARVLLDDPRRAEALGLAAWARAADYALETMTERTVAAYRRLSGRPRQGAAA